jgi:tripartite-type tricarboxylate transporter receptor subunit TctC
VRFVIAFGPGGVGDTTSLRGDIDVAVEAYAAFRGNFDDGKLRPLATSAPTRSALLPNVPTAKEDGAGDYDITAWSGLFVKTGTPADIVARLNKARCSPTAISIGACWRWASSPIRPHPKS